VEPGVVLAAAPDHDHESAAGHEGPPHVAHRHHRVGDEHRAEAREGQVVGTAEIVWLHVGDLEAHVCDAGSRRLAAGGLDKPWRRVHADHGTAGRHETRDPLRLVAEPAADVEHALPRLRREEP
jgi:hypothetical protein